jgi:Iap family predicted aminopeptidase
MLRLVALACVLTLAACAKPVPIDTSCVDEPLADVVVGRLARQELDAGLDALERDNAQRAAAIERLFREAGCGESLRLEEIPRSRFHNVICTLHGTGARRIVVGAHYDKVEAGEGAADNWSGAVLLPSLYRSLATRDRTHTIELIAFGAEEEGLIGSRAHVAALDVTSIGEIAAMINLDTLGLGTTKVERKASDPRLLCFLLRSVLLLESPVELVNADGVGTSDYAPFKKAGVPVVSIHSIDQDTLDTLHSAKDTLVAIDRDAYYETYRLISVYVALLDGRLR